MWFKLKGEFGEGMSFLLGTKQKTLKKICGFLRLCNPLKDISFLFLQFVIEIFLFQNTE